MLSYFFANPYRKIFPSISPALESIMKTEKQKHIGAGKGEQAFSCFLLFVSCLLIFVSVTACGRRGDPVAILPHGEEELKIEAKDNVSGQAGAPEVPGNDNETGVEAVETAQPDAPTGLVGVFSQNGIILAWDEVMEQGVKFYRIYRSSEGEYLLVGTSVTPSFIDRDIKQEMKYYYKVRAIGQSEGPLSEEIIVLREVQ